MWCKDFKFKCNCMLCCGISSSPQVACLKARMSSWWKCLFYSNIWGNSYQYSYSPITTLAIHDHCNPLRERKKKEFSAWAIQYKIWLAHSWASVLYQMLTCFDFQAENSLEQRIGAEFSALFIPIVFSPTVVASIIMQLPYFSTPYTFHLETRIILLLHIT